MRYHCPTPPPYWEYAPVNYTVGGVQWDPELPGAVSNSFSATAYVMVTSDDPVLPNLGRVDIGTASWTVSCNLSHYTTNCVEGVVLLVNPTGSTNVCLGDVVGIEVTEGIIDALIIVTSNRTNACGNIDTNNCPSIHTTNSVTPTILSNWWTVSGPGGYSNSSEGLSAWFIPTNGGSGTVEFNLKWQNPTPCNTNFQTATMSVGFTVDTNCPLWFKVTNCTVAGSVRLTNATITTNVCVGTAVNASVSEVLSNAQIIVTSNYTNTCGAVTPNCPSTHVTNSVAPTIVSNWWTVTGPGSYTNSGSGLSASFTPTNGGSGTVTFNLTYTNSTPCDTNVQSATPVSLNFNVIQITSECVATTPTNRSRLTIGVGEEVEINLAGSPAGTFTWSTSAGTLSTTNGTPVTLTAPERDATATVTVYFPDGSCNCAFTVVEPASESAVILSTNSYPAGTQGAGMQLRVFVAPTTVSFRNVECLEVPGPATDVTGYFTNYTAARLAHNPNTNWTQLSVINTWLDTAAFSGFPSPWYAGGFQWDIPVQWRVVGSTNEAALPNRTQTFSISNTNGTSTVSKLGLSVTRTP